MKIKNTKLALFLYSHVYGPNNIHHFPYRRFSAGYIYNFFFMHPENVFHDSLYVFLITVGFVRPECAVTFNSVRICRGNVVDSPRGSRRFRAWNTTEIFRVFATKKNSFHSKFRTTSLGHAFCGSFACAPAPSVDLSYADLYGSSAAYKTHRRGTRDARLEPLYSDFPGSSGTSAPQFDEFYCRDY